MKITDMDPADFCEALAQLEAEAASAKVRGESNYVAIDTDLALDLVRLATALVRVEIDQKKFREGFGYKKANDPWAMAMDAAQAG